MAIIRGSLKAFLLGAGLGTRLRPLTNEIPKCLLPIGEKPLLQIWLEHLARHRIDEVLINTHHHAEQVEEFVRGYKGVPHIRLEYEETLLGSGGTVYRHRDFVQSEDEFWVIYGDNLSSVDLGQMLEFHRRREALATIGLFEVENPKQCGIATLDETGRVIEFVEKPADPKGNLANAGIYLLSNRVFEQVRWGYSLPMDFGFHILPQLVGRMYGYPIKEYHLDI
ncbi:MAG: nucleotidyltransferase family protein, partial [Candidatus Marinimicrobia bacterium]|nr:nucleotidyltransferase family protein [Candidatus Neomarinimicrobiota bacterium]